MNQETIFRNGEGDRWNRELLEDGSRASHDPVLELIRALRTHPKRVLEVGCSNGWRLAELHSSMHYTCTGVDVSKRAITEGKKRWPALNLRRASLSDLPFADSSFDLVIAPFVLHWVDRALLLKSLAEIDRVLAAGGHLIISDFLPGKPQRVSYHRLE